MALVIRINPQVGSLQPTFGRGPEPARGPEPESEPGPGPADEPSVRPLAYKVNDRCNCRAELRIPFDTVHSRRCLDRFAPQWSRKSQRGPPSTTWLPTRFAFASSCLSSVFWFLFLCFCVNPDVLTPDVDQTLIHRDETAIALDPRRQPADLKLMEHYSAPSGNPASIQTPRSPLVLGNYVPVRIFCISVLYGIYFRGFLGGRLPDLSGYNPTPNGETHQFGL